MGNNERHRCLPEAAQALGDVEKNTMRTHSQKKRNPGVTSDCLVTENKKVKREQKMQPSRQLLGAGMVVVGETRRG